MITLKLINYDEAELRVLKKALREAKQTLEPVCESLDVCDHCPVKKVCRDLDSAKRYVQMKINEGKVQK